MHMAMGPAGAHARARVRAVPLGTRHVARGRAGLPRKEGRRKQSSTCHGEPPTAKTLDSSKG